MRFPAYLLLILFWCQSLATAQSAIQKESIIILYNSDDAQSKELAEYYANKREIPLTQLVGLPLPKKRHITRDEYNTLIKEPLVKLFDQKSWWQTGKTKDGLTIAVRNKIRLIVSVRGVPFGVKQNSVPLEGDNQAKLKISNRASVDSELAALGIIDAPINGPLVNKYYKSTERFANTRLPFTMLTGRIDGPTFEIAKQLIDDAIDTEKTGLWGMCYLDFAHKGASYKVGDDWIENIEKENWKHGIPTTVDHNKQTYLTNYPMRDVALYYGWYISSVNGTFLDPNFRLKKGSIAIHIHSYSASDIHNAGHHWVGPLLKKGAAATVGNVYEPYLSLTHNLDILHDRLLKGFTLVEAAAAAMPALSWQGLVVGDPLYRPYLHLDGSGEVRDEDKVYRAINLAWSKWANDPDKLITKLRSAAAKTKDARLYEVCGLWYIYMDNMQAAAAFFNSAEKSYLSPRDEIRITLHLADMYRKIGKKADALKLLRETLESNKDEPAAESLRSLITILDPPPPPPAEPRKK
ncbi:TIGR03790 family protein [Rubritalea squalenifaciens DSM 18772]|uniref:TIGR03790 family protein n=2 Tax=Rubritalea TaxID=361050 RepID=A0A1M6I316_9BACT|nr:TIGR03790 family protein [Rubritalea squalenifaciens]SHJ28836.1 TIGR03790 family protein [Rubritalea squalenifaciens DSM 18772]